MNILTSLFKIGVALLFILIASVKSDAHKDHDSVADIAAHLEFKEGTLHVHAYFKDSPIVGKRSTLFLETRSGETHDLLDIEDQIQVVLWMPTMNHGSAPTRVQKMKNQLGLYQVSNVNFVMGGLWELRITLTDLNQVSETQTFELEFPESGHHHKH